MRQFNCVSGQEVDCTQPPAQITLASPVRGRPLPQGLVEVAQVWLASNSAALIWLIGPPGSGKTTLLAACRIADPQIVTVELARLLPSEGVVDGPPRSGGLQALGRVAESMRANLRQSPRRAIIAATGLPSEVAKPQKGEALVVIQVAMSRCTRQLLDRPPRRARAANTTELEMHYRNASQLASLPQASEIQIPFIEALVGRLEDD